LVAVMRVERNKGQSSLEVLIALSILVLSMTAAIVVGFGNQSAAVQTQLNNRAVYTARQALEDLRAQAREDFSLVASSTSEDGAYTKEVSVTDLGTYSKEVVLRLLWELNGQEKSVELSTIITDWRTAYEQSGTGDGGSDPIGDWTNPLTAGTVDLGPGNEGNDVAIMGDTVFMVGEASDSKKNDILSIDVSNINSPSFIDAINTGPGLNSIALWRDYAYVANTDTSGQLQVIDISSPTALSLVSTTALPDNSEKGAAVFAKDDYAYIGTHNSASGNELFIFNVSNPASPQLVSSIEIADNVNDLYVFKDRLYVAASKLDKELLIFDVSDPSSPVEIGSYDNPGGTGQSISVTSMGTAYLGVNNNMVILDTEDLGDIYQLGTYNAGGNINDLYIRGDLAFLATSNSNEEFQTVDVRDLSNPQLHSEFNFPQVATEITYLNNVVYVSVRSNDALRIITSQQ
jgi:hypothetical protein